MIDDTTRRQLLRACGAAGVAGLSGLAGCGGGGGNSTPTPRNTEQDDTATPTPTETGPDTSYRRWLPAADRLQGDPNYTYIYYDTAQFREYKDALSATGYGRVEQATKNVTSTLGVEPTDVSQIIQFIQSDLRVVTGSFDPAAVEKAMQSGGYRKHSKAKALRIYAGGKNPPVVGVGDGFAVLTRSTGTNTAPAVARLLTETANGELPRYHESREAFDLVTRDLTDVSHAGAGLIGKQTETNVESGVFRGQVGFGTGFTFGSSTTDLRYVLAFANERTASQAPVTTWVEDHSAGLDAYSDVNVSVDGRTVTVTGSVPTGDFDYLRG